MSGRVVKTRAGKTGRIDNRDEPVLVEVSDSEGNATLVRKFLVMLDDGTKIICYPGKLEYIGYWD